MQLNLPKTPLEGQFLVVELRPCEKYQAKEIELVTDSMKVLIINTSSSNITKTA